MSENDLNSHVTSIGNSVSIVHSKQSIAHFIFSSETQRLVMKLLAVLLTICCFSVGVLAGPTAKEPSKGLEWNNLKSFLPMPMDPLKLNSVNQTWCTCGVFFSGQFKKMSNEPPKGQPVLMHEQDSQYPCTPLGTKQCSNKCLEVVS